MAAVNMETAEFEKWSIYRLPQQREKPNALYLVKSCLKNMKNEAFTTFGNEQNKMNYL